MKQVTTIDDVFKALGGLTKTAALVGKTAQHAHGWKTARKFPAKTFIALNAALAERDIAAPASLWGMVEPEPNQKGAA